MAPRVISQARETGESLRAYYEMSTADVRKEKEDHARVTREEETKSLGRRPCQDLSAGGFGDA